jgi:hypothetical protein
MAKRKDDTPVVIPMSFEDAVKRLLKAPPPRKSVSQKAKNAKKR